MMPAISDFHVTRQKLNACIDLVLVICIEETKIDLVVNLG